MTRAELRAALDDLELFTRNAFRAANHADYSSWAQQAVNKRKEIRAAVVDGSRLIEYTQLATEAERTGNSTSLTSLRTTLRSAELR